MMWLAWAIGISGGAALIAYLVVVTDGTYLGRHTVRWFYDRLAAVWSYPDAPELRVADRDHLMPLIRSALDGSTAGRVLDVATGTARLPLLLETEALWFGGEVIGLDASPNMLARGRRNLAATKGRLRIDLVEGWAESLGWPDGAFDLVTCFEAFHNFGDPLRALAEMCRVLRPGGTLMIDKVSDRHARLIPGKALTRKGFALELSQLGMERFEVRTYERRLGTVELVVAVKPLKSGQRVDL